MKRTYVDITGEYYDNLDDVIDLEASGINSYRNNSDLKKVLYYTNNNS